MTRTALMTAAASTLATFRDDWPADDAPSEDEVRRATAVLTRDYMGNVRDVVVSLLDAVASGEVTDAGEMSERMHEKIDGHQRVIYTWQARCGLLVSDHEDAYAEETDGSADPSVLMYWAMLADVHEAMPEIDWDANDEGEDGASV